MASALSTDATQATTSSGPARSAGAASGLGIDRYGPSNESGTHASSPNTAAATDTPAHHRQRGDGSDPVGVSSRIKPTQTGIGTVMPAEAAAT